MQQLRVEPLSTKFSIVKDHLWCIYDGEQPLFHGSVSECRDWLDRNEALSLDLDGPPASNPAERPRSVWSTLFRSGFRSSRTL